MRQIGPVNYAIRNSKGVEKIYHRNLLKPALERSEPKFMATSRDDMDILTYLLTHPLGYSYQFKQGRNSIIVEKFCHRLIGRVLQTMFSDRIVWQLLRILDKLVMDAQVYQ